jgi:hypothetical protein
MPQTNVLQDWKNTYPLDAAAQKPGGVTISTTLWTHAVPNKPQWTGTQMMTAEEESHGEAAQEEEEVYDDSEEEETEEDENGHPRPRRSGGRRRRR